MRCHNFNVNLSQISTLKCYAERLAGRWAARCWHSCCMQHLFIFPLMQATCSNWRDKYLHCILMAASEYDYLLNKQSTHTFFFRLRRRMEMDGKWPEH